MSPEAIWYQSGHPLSTLLLPLSWLYSLVARMRRFAYRSGWLPSYRLPVAVIVIGNLTVGGTGKTPLVLWLTGFLRRRGYSPGIVTRGYGGCSEEWPRMVTASSDPREVGDEAVLLARRSGCPVVAGPDRVAAARKLIALGACDIMVTDDGLQHYRLRRDLEILVVDGSRGFGNGRCLPAGPLREPVSRRRHVDFSVCNGGGCEEGWEMRLVPEGLVNLRNPELSREVAALSGHRVTAVAGIGNPGRFFKLLRGCGLRLDERPYPDHHPFSAADAASWPGQPIVMTEKDAVKCEAFAGEDYWYVPVTAQMDPHFEQRLAERLATLASPTSTGGSGADRRASTN